MINIVCSHAALIKNLFRRIPKIPKYFEPWHYYDPKAPLVGWKYPVEYDVRMRRLSKKCSNGIDIIRCQNISSGVKEENIIFQRQDRKCLQIFEEGLKFTSDHVPLNTILMPCYWIYSEMGFPNDNAVLEFDWAGSSACLEHPLNWYLKTDSLSSLLNWEAPG